MPNLILVMIGGAIGAGLRYKAGHIAVHFFGINFPWGTLIVNLVGGLLMGLLAGVALREGQITNSPLLLFLGVGLLGGFTTFSAFSYDAAQMIERGELAIAAAYATTSVAGSIILLFVGLWLAKAAA